MLKTSKQQNSIWEQAWISAFIIANPSFQTTIPLSPVD